MKKKYVLIGIVIVILIGILVCISIVGNDDKTEGLNKTNQELCVEGNNVDEGKQSEETPILSDKKAEDSTSTETETTKSTEEQKQEESENQKAETENPDSKEANEDEPIELPFVPYE